MSSTLVVIWSPTGIRYEAEPSTIAKISGRHISEVDALLADAVMAGRLRLNNDGTYSATGEVLGILHKAIRADKAYLKNYAENKRKPFKKP